jgi:hypothetical protein
MPAAFRPARRLLAAILLGVFLATAPGGSVLELAWHLAATDDPHAKAPHLEAAGSTAHADHCQVGLAHADGRLPAAAPVRLLDTILSDLPGPGRGPARLFTRAAPAALPRAPPALG